MENKKHYKLYKSGKLWCVAAIATVILGVTGLSQIAHADTNNQVQTEQVATANTNEQLAATPSVNNQVPQDTKTQNNQVNANLGNLDSYSLTEGQSGQAEIKVSGWHATGQSNNDPYRYLLVFDNTRGQEVARQKIAPQARTDVHAAYANVANSANSGFNATITIPNDVVSHSLSLISRYSSDPNNGEGKTVDHWFGPLYIDQSNRANLDGLKSDGKTLTVSGWHATNQAGNRPYHYIIAFDQNKGREIARQEVKAVNRPDVAKAFPTIANAARAGFSVNFNLTQPFFNDNIQFISRWTDDPAGNGSAVDYWFNPITKANRSNLDGYNLSNGTLNVTGWHADDVSLLEPNHFLILFDNTLGRQVAAKQVKLTASEDVANVFGDTKTANQARFNYNFGKLALVANHNYSLVSRYSSSNQGNGGNGAFADAWMSLGALNQAGHSLDNWSLNNGQLNIQGWMASDQALNKPYAFAIVLANGHEIGRQKLTLSQRNDVAKVFPQMYNSGKSGFNASFAIPTEYQNSKVQLVLRFTNDPDGNGNASDFWEAINLAAANAKKNLNAAQAAKTQTDNEVNAKQSAVNEIQNRLNGNLAKLSGVPANGDDNSQASPNNPDILCYHGPNYQEIQNKFWNENPNENARYLSDSDRIPATHTLVPLSDETYQTDMNLRHVYIKSQINEYIGTKNNKPINYNLSVNLTNYALELINQVRTQKGLKPLITDSTIISNSIKALPSAHAHIEKLGGMNVRIAPNLDQYGIETYYMGDNDMDGTATSAFSKGAYWPMPVDAPTGWMSIDNYHRAVWTYLKDGINSVDFVINDLINDPSVKSIAIQFQGWDMYVFVAKPAPKNTNTTALEQAVQADQQALSQAKSALSQAQAKQSQAAQTLKQAQDTYAQLTK